jgi:pimeloyl-ACP methyl ester carboxylesterase
VGSTWRLPALLLAVLLPILAVLLLMASMQTELLFPTHAVPAAGPFPPGAERLQVTTKGGETLHGILLKPANQAGPKTMILGFGGNAWNGQDVAEYLHEAFPDAHVVAFHYRGYRPSTGSPSAEALLEDAPLVLRAAADRVKPDHIVAVGLSIGSGVAASLARQPGVDGLVLVTPFDSLKAVAGDLYPWLPIGPFFQHEIDTADLLRDAQVPVAIIAAERDEIIPSSRTSALRPQVSRLVFDRTIAGAGHNDIYGRDDFQQALRVACNAVAAK